MGGKGPLLHEVQLGSVPSKKIIFTVLTCSDAIHRVKTGSPVQKSVIRESSEKHVGIDDIRLCIIPAFSRKDSEFKKLGEVDAIREHGITVLSNWEPYGGSCIWFPLLNGSKTCSTDPIEALTTGFILADIPMKYVGSPKTTHIASVQKNAESKCQFVKIAFEGEEVQDYKGRIERIESESFSSLVSKRLTTAIIISGIVITKVSPGEELKIAECCKEWKLLQGKLCESFPDSNPRYIYYCSSDIIAFCEAIKKGSLYEIVLSKLEQYIPEDKITIQHIMDKTKEMNLPPPNLWSIDYRARR